MMFYRPQWLLVTWHCYEDLPQSLNVNTQQANLVGNWKPQSTGMTIWTTLLGWELTGQSKPHGPNIMSIAFKDNMPFERYTEIIVFRTKNFQWPQMEEYLVRKKYSRILCLSANLLSNIHTLINPDLYVKTTYLNFSQRI